MCFDVWLFPQFLGAPNLPVYAVDCSNTGTGILTGPVVHALKLEKDQYVTAIFEIPVSRCFTLPYLS